MYKKQLAKTFDGRIRNNVLNNNNKDYKRSRTALGIENEEEDEELKVIDMRGMCLHSIPTPSIHLAYISKLHISNNNLQTIPESLIARMKNVAEIDAHSNRLTFLPNSIGCLSKLKFLNVSGNLLISLPRTIEDCRSLEELNANFNKLKSLPNTIGFELQSLRKLSVNSNKLNYLPYSIFHLSELRILDVRLNCLRSLPEDIENLTKLQTLNASQNFQYLKELPSSIGLLMSLVELDISYNKLTSLPTSLGLLRKLERLSVQGNPLVFPPMEMIDQGLCAMRRYMSEKINGYHQDEGNKKKSWFRQLGNYKTFNGRNRRMASSAGIYRSIDALATPGFNLGRFSPRRFFSSPGKG